MPERPVQADADLNRDVQERNPTRRPQADADLGRWAAMREVASLSVPTMAQMGSYTVMQFIDGWMLSRLGTEAPTAVGNAGMLAYAFVAFGSGLLFLVNTLTSQDYGAGGADRCGKWLWQGMWFAVVYSLALLPLLPIAGATFRWFGHPQHLAHQEAVYFQIVLAFSMVKLVGVSAGQFLLATERPGTATLAAGVGVGVNAVVAFVLVMGKFGLKSYGVAGAAWAQNIGLVVEAAVLLAYAFGRKSRGYGVGDWRPRVVHLKRLLGIGFGAGLQSMSEVFAWSLFMVIVVGQLGETAMAANQFTFRYLAISSLPGFGIAQAVTSLAGRSIGAGRPDLALRRADLGYWLATSYMLACGVAFAAFRYPLMRFFTDDKAVQHAGATLLLFAAAYQLFDAINVIYTGALRGVCDTFVPALVVAGLCWGVNVAGGWAVARYAPQWGVAGPWLATLAYVLALAAFAAVRFRRGKWQSLTLPEGARCYPLRFRPSYGRH